MNADAIPACLGPRVPARSPRWRAPAGSWDTQFHVLGPTSRHPYAADRHYTPPPASLADWARMAGRLGIDHGTVVHANTQGPANDVYLEAVDLAPRRLVAVVKLGAECTPAMAAALHARGVRGVRFAFNPQHGGHLDRDVVDHVVACVQPLGWFLQLHFDGQALPSLEPWIASLPLPVVIDHLGRVRAREGIDAPPQRALTRLALLSNVWTKVSGLDRICSGPARYDEAAGLVQRLVEVAADRLLWGSDWPHTGYFDPAAMPDDVALFDAFVALVPDERVRVRMLVANPRRLLHLEGAS